MSGCSLAPVPLSADCVGDTWLCKQHLVYNHRHFHGAASDYMLKGMHALSCNQQVLSMPVIAALASV